MKIANQPLVLKCNEYVSMFQMGSCEIAEKSELNWNNTLVCKYGFPLAWNFNLTVTGIFGTIKMRWFTNKMNSKWKSMTNRSQCGQDASPSTAWYKLPITSQVPSYTIAMSSSASCSACLSPENTSQLEYHTELAPSRMGFVFEIRGEFWVAS